MLDNRDTHVQFIATAIAAIHRKIRDFWGEAGVFGKGGKYGLAQPGNVWYTDKAVNSGLKGSSKNKSYKFIPRHFVALVNFCPTMGENLLPRLDSLSKQVVLIF
jgi:hypothetical protein